MDRGRTGCYLARMGPCSMPRASPHTRGWTPVALASSGQSGRGEVASPHTRGWTREVADAPCGHAAGGFPAHAGMDPLSWSKTSSRRARAWLPRTRGDGPDATRRTTMLPWLPRTRGDGPRSQSKRRGRTRHVSQGFPAHAGMDPTSIGFPAHAGMTPDTRHRQESRLPRTRGDGPGSSRRVTGDRASPHTRGWTPVACRSLSMQHRGFPAHAGMDPARKTAPDRSGEASPHTRGWTLSWSHRRGLSDAASPHTRGWTLRSGPVRAGRRRCGFPAHAGMDPRAAAASSACRRASPHTRGWTRHTVSVADLPEWLPRTRGDGPFRSQTD